MSDDLITWLRAQLDEDELLARTMAERGWYLQLRDSGIQPTGRLARYIARWDPAGVLAEVDAKRRILDLRSDGYGAEVDGFNEAVAAVTDLLALPYADRPGYRDEWGP